MTNFIYQETGGEILFALHTRAVTVTFVSL